jgi:hypothetical protein
MRTKTGTLAECIEMDMDGLVKVGVAQTIAGDAPD